LNSVFCIQVQSGHLIWELAESLEKNHNITLWHRFLGLPGSIGGAVFGNAGCFGLEIGPYVERVYILDLKTGLELEKTGVELVFDYRWSECKNHPEWFLLSVVLDFSELREKYPAPLEEPLAWRERVQPEGYSCGSFFKNPSREHSAGSLIEQAGLK
jgi:UDP-N-acetylmuramate dehydrogenase